MKETQPLITDADEYAGYQRALRDINAECLEREQDVFQSQNDPAKLERVRAALFRMYRIRQGILDRIKEYERQRLQPQRRHG
ncbi:MAG TPA: hypothetical protein VKQ36_16495 [Ktedonobacterales bacterium]|nr:hypothetical protein [Ktedonobacterales bacterium]